MISSFFLFFPASTCHNQTATLLGQILVPQQSDYKELVAANQKCELFHDQEGLCGLFALYNGYCLLSKIKPIEVHPSVCQELVNFFMLRLPQGHLDYFKKFENFYAHNQSLETIEIDRPNRFGYLNLLQLEKIIAAHPDYKKNNEHVFVTALSYIQDSNKKEWPTTSLTSKKVLQEAYRFRANPCNPLLLILCLNTDSDKKKHHWVALLLTKDVTWVADSNNDQDNLLIHSHDIHFVDAFFRNVPLPLPPEKERLTFEQDVNFNPNFSQELLTCFATQPGTVFAKPLISQV